MNLMVIIVSVQVAAEIVSNGGSAKIFKADVSKVSSIQEAFASIKQAYGAIDISVINSGAFESKNVYEADEAHFDKLFNINTKGAFLDRKSTRLNSSHVLRSRMPSSA